jgi:hypothetical protein
MLRLIKIEIKKWRKKEPIRMDIIHSENATKKTKIAKCDRCKAKLSVMAYTCRCEKKYCITHLPAIEHACTFNYRGQANKVLATQLDNSGLANKLEKI